MSSDILSVRGVSKTFGSGIRALDDVSLDVAAGTTVGVVGESGSGKSTLAKIVLRLVRADAGTVTVDGQDYLTLRGAGLRRAQAQVGFVPQHSRESLNPRATVRASIDFVLRVQGWNAGRRRQRVTEMLDAVALPPAAGDRYPHELSGGQLQRVSIARALATSPRLLVCDEAVSALDKNVQAQVLNLLAALQRDTGVAYLFITHDLAVVEHIADTVVVMYRGRVVETGATAQVCRAPRDTYTRTLIAAVPGTHRKQLEGTDK